MGRIVELPSIKPRTTSPHRGLRKPSPDLIGKARDENAAQVTRMLPFSRFSWRSKGLLSASAAIIAAGVMLGFGPWHRPFDLFRANLSGQWLVAADLRKANLGLATLRDANLRRANLSGAILIGATLSSADLNQARLDRADLGLATLRDVDLRGANLSGADLYDADLSGANLSGAILSDARLSGANLSHAYLSNAKNLAQKQLDEACGNANTKLPEGLTLKPCSTD